MPNDDKPEKILEIVKAEVAFRIAEMLEKIKKERGKNE
jgi:hypothetical protein